MNEKIKAAFDGVRAEESLKRDTRAYLARRIERVKGRSVAPRRLIAAFAACLAVALLGLGGYGLYFTPVSAISIDVNPSVELGVNRFDRVVSAEGYNEAGVDFIAGVNIQNQYYADALEILLSSDGMRAYLDGGAEVSITVVGSTDEKGDEMLKRISACPYASSPNVRCRGANREEVAAAHEAGLSYGKYRAFLELQALDPTATAQSVQGLTMRQIRDRIAAASGESAQGTRGKGRGAGGKGQGAGYGQGRGNRPGKGE